MRWSGDLLPRDRDRLNGLVDGARADGRQLDTRALAGARGDGTGKRLRWRAWVGA